MTKLFSFILIFLVTANLAIAAEPDFSTLESALKEKARMTENLCQNVQILIKTEKEPLLHWLASMPESECKERLGNTSTNEGKAYLQKIYGSFKKDMLRNCKTDKECIEGFNSDTANRFNVMFDTIMMAWVGMSTACYEAVYDRLKISKPLSGICASLPASLPDTPAWKSLLETIYSSTNDFAEKIENNKCGGAESPSFSQKLKVIFPIGTSMKNLKTALQNANAKCTPGKENNHLICNAKITGFRFNIKKENDAELNTVFFEEHISIHAYNDKAGNISNICGDFMSVGF